MADESDIIERVLSGDTESFRLLVERYESPVIRTIANLTGNRESCEDIAQDVFLTAYMRLEAFDPARSRFSTWLLTIARNRCINAMKKKRPVCVDPLPEIPDPCDPAERATEQEMLARLDKVLEALPAGQRRAFILAEFEALPYEQIAQIEGTRIGTIRSRISRARHRLTETLRRYGADEE